MTHPFSARAVNGYSTFKIDNDAVHVTAEKDRLLTITRDPEPEDSHFCRNNNNNPEKPAMDRWGTIFMNDKWVDNYGKTTYVSKSDAVRCD